MVDNMEWFNVFGLIFIAVIMIPNVVFAIKCKDGFDNKWNNKYVEVTEQVGRLGCFGFMIINIPGTWFGWWSDEATKTAVWEVYKFIHVNTVAPFGTFRTKIRKWKKIAL